MKSVIEAVITGTRRAIPSKRPLRSGMVSVVARAAPVEVGTILADAARARLRSL